MTIAVFFPHRWSSDRRFLQTLLRGLGRGSLLGLFILGFLLVLSVLFLFLAGFESAFAQTRKPTELETEIERLEGRSVSAQVKKHYLGGGLSFVDIAGERTVEEETGPFYDTRTHTVSDSLDGSGVGIRFSYIYAVNERFWVAGSYAGGVASSDEEDEDGPDIEYSSVDLHLLLKTSGSFFFGGGVSQVSYENDFRVSNRRDDKFEVSGLAPSLRVGFFIPLESVAWMLDASWHGEVNSEGDDRIESETSFISYQISASLLWNF